LFGEIIHVDDFGNIITNIMLNNLEKLNIRLGAKTKISMGNRTKEVRFCKTYDEVKEGELLALVGSTGFLEISINKGHAASIYRAKEGIGLSISLV
jgi:S-adenosylmethionine hydrolase